MYCTIPNARCEIRLSAALCLVETSFARFQSTHSRPQSSTMSSDKGGDPSAFLADYKQEGGWYNEESFGLARYPGMGLGGVALQDIEVCLCPVLVLGH